LEEKNSVQPTEIQYRLKKKEFMKAILTFFGIFFTFISFTQEEDPNAFKETFEVGGYASFDYAYRYISAETDTSFNLFDNITNANDQDNFAPRFSIGFNYIQSLGENARIYTGLGYSLKGYTSNNVVVVDTAFSYSPYATTFSTAEMMRYNIKRNYHYLEIPFGFGFLFPLRNYWTFVPDIGVYGGILIVVKNKKSAPLASGNSSSQQYLGELVENRHSIQLATSMMFRKQKPESNFAMEFGPEVRLGLFNTHFMEKNLQHKTYLYSINLKVRFTGVFEMKKREDEEPISEGGD
jgi:hypothetical protein